MTTQPTAQQIEWSRECIADAMRSGRCVRTVDGNPGAFALDGSVPLVGRWPIVRVDFRSSRDPRDVAMAQSIARADVFQPADGADRYSPAARRWHDGGTLRAPVDTGRELASYVVNVAGAFPEAL